MQNIWFNVFETWPHNPVRLNLDINEEHCLWEFLFRDILYLQHAIIVGYIASSFGFICTDIVGLQDMQSFGTCNVILWFGAAKFTHTFKDYVTGTGAIILLSQWQWNNPEGYR